MQGSAAPQATRAEYSVPKFQFHGNTANYLGFGVVWLNVILYRERLRVRYHGDHGGDDTPYVEVLEKPVKQLATTTSLPNIHQLSRYNLQL